jgi:hypothetical protein
VFGSGVETRDTQRGVEEEEEEEEEEKAER